MEYFTLGSTMLRVSRMAVGCWAIGGHGWGQVNDRESIAAIRAAVELGINFFDTADVYGLGHSEEILSEALGHERHRVVIATKFGVTWDNEARIGRDISPDYVARAVEGSLRRLRIDSIPLYQIHWPDNVTAISDTMSALKRCQDQGKIQYIGCCNFSSGLLSEAASFAEISSIQLPHNLLKTAVEKKLISACKANGVSFLSYSPLAHGLLSGKYSEDVSFSTDDIRGRSEYFSPSILSASVHLVQLLRDIGLRHGKTPAQVAIRWVLDSPPVDGVLVGVKTTKQIQENIGSLDWQLTPLEWRELDDLANRLT